MSKPFNIGDRVRYRAELVEEGFLHPRKLELTGKILRLPQSQKKCYLVKWNDVADSENFIHGSWLESMPPSGRTFEEIVKELAEKPEFKEKWKANFEWAERTVLLTNARGFMLHFFDDGDLRFEADIENGSHTDIFTAAQLAAISAACSEIAANFAAEHGKEEK